VPGPGHGHEVVQIPMLRGSSNSLERSALFARLRREPVVKAGRWARDELYDDAP
jgi:hypothetical protein